MRIPILLSTLLTCFPGFCSPSINFDGALVGSIYGEITRTCKPSISSGTTCVSPGDALADGIQARLVVWPVVQNDLHFEPVGLSLTGLDETDEYKVDWRMEAAWETGSFWTGIAEPGNNPIIAGHGNTCSDPSNVLGPLGMLKQNKRISENITTGWVYCWYERMPNRNPQFVAFPYTEIYEDYGQLGDLLYSNPIKMQPIGSKIHEGPGQSLPRICYRLYVRGDLSSKQSNTVVARSDTKKFVVCGDIDGIIPIPVNCEVGGFTPIDLGVVGIDELITTGVQGSSTGLLQCDQTTSFTVSVLQSSFDNAQSLELTSGLSINSSLDKTEITGTVLAGVPSSVSLNVSALGASTSGVKNGNVVLSIIFY
ncbi:hypothetical protein [Providencia sp. Je.9.19]|uniref:hypothetical protein n=1 Tax=Providencia sp. Je.9.19 TaxID=3142844 RepID=UPI003DA9AA67